MNEPGGVDVSQATVLAGVLIANIGALVGGLVSMKVAIAKLEVKVDHLREDVDDGFESYRMKTKNKKEGSE